jgi:hypothetical protein
MKTRKREGLNRWAQERSEPKDWFSPEQDHWMTTDDLLESCFQTRCVRNRSSHFDSADSVHVPSKTVHYPVYVTVEFNEEQHCITLDSLLNPYRIAIEPATLGFEASPIGKSVPLDTSRRKRTGQVIKNNRPDRAQDLRAIAVIPTELKGKWVALLGGEIIDTSSSFASLRKRISEKNLPMKPLLHWVL